MGCRVAGSLLIQWYLSCLANKVRPKTTYHIHLIENAGFLEDLFSKTKPSGACQGSQIRDVACTLTEIQLLIASFRTVENPDAICVVICDAK